MFQQNQIVLVKFYLRQNEDQAWKLFGKGEFGTVGWTVSNLDSLWGFSVQIFFSLKLVFLPLTRIIKQPTRERSKGVDVDSPLCDPTTVSPQVLYGKDILFEHKNSGLFLCQFTLDEIQEYMNLFHDSPRYEWLWLGKNYRYVDRLWFGEFD